MRRQISRIELLNFIGDGNPRLKFPGAHWHHTRVSRHHGPHKKVSYLQARNRYTTNPYAPVERSTNDWPR